MSERLTATYHVTADAASIEARARAIAVEQSVEMPVDGIDDPQVLNHIVGRVEGITERAPGHYEVRIGLATATIAGDPGQLFNMLFGNTSIQDGIELVDADLPAALLASFPGPNLGAGVGLRLNKEFTLKLSYIASPGASRKPFDEESKSVWDKKVTMGLTYQL